MPQATWFKDGAEKLISTSSHMHHSLVFFARPISQFHSSEFIFSYSSPPKVGIQAAFKRRPIKAALPKDGIDHNSSATCSPEIEQDHGLFVVDLAQVSASSVADSHARKDVPNAVESTPCDAVPLLAVQFCQF